MTEWRVITFDLETWGVNPRKSSGETVQVLCVDDDSDFVDLTAAYLERDGRLNVVAETDVTEAYDRLRNGEITTEAIVSDYQMPEMDGLTFLRRVREIQPELPFILFTGKGSEDVASDAISAGVTDYLQKGGRGKFDLLANRVWNAVDSYRMRKTVEHERSIREWILTATPVGIVGHDLAGDVVFRNDRATDILASDVHELDGKAYEGAGWTLLTTRGEPVPESQLPYRRVLDAGTHLHGEQYRLRTSDGRDRRLVIHGAPMRNASNELDGAVITFYVPDDHT